MTLYVSDYASWGQIGAAGTVLEAPTRRTFVAVHNADGDLVRVVPVRVEASYVTSPQNGGWECSSLTIVGVPEGATTAGDTVASQYVGPLAVATALTRLPEVFREFVARNNPARSSDH